MGVNIGSPYHFYLDYAQLWPGGTNAAGIATNGYFVGSSTTPTNGTLVPSYNPFGIQATINNSQATVNDNGTNGVAGDNNGCAYSSEAPDLIITNSVYATNVTTGVELAIPLAALGSPTGAINVCAFIGNYNGGQPGGFVSNQFLPPVGTNGVCAGPLATGNSKTVNLGALPGAPHFFSVGPEMRVTGVGYAISGGATNVSVTVLPGEQREHFVQVTAHLRPADEHLGLGECDGLSRQRRLLSHNIHRHTRNQQGRNGRRNIVSRSADPGLRHSVSAGADRCQHKRN